MLKIIGAIITAILVLVACGEDPVVKQVWEGHHADYVALVEEVKGRVDVILKAVEQRPSRISGSKENGVWIRIWIGGNEKSYCSWFAHKDGTSWQISSPLCPNDEIPTEMQSREAIGELILLLDTTVSEIQKGLPRVWRKSQMLK